LCHKGAFAEGKEKKYSIEGLGEEVSIRQVKNNKCLKVID